MGIAGVGRRVRYAGWLVALAVGAASAGAAIGLIVVVALAPLVTALGSGS